MAATRKLQGEIDRCLKKVAEGVETFEETWKKVHNTTNSNQKQKHLQEKYEADLKKEIKKLQRLRDQIKTWIASTEIKDKATLLENRRLIETQMERFKVVERETKTKAYSKEGLGAAQKLDPKQRVKDSARTWLNNSIQQLLTRVDKFETEMELLVAAKKKRLDRDKQEKLEDLRRRVDKHKYHISKLEQLLRLLDNDGVDADQVHKIKEDVEYFIESSDEPDYEENTYIYDDIAGLDEVELGNTAVPNSAATDSNETSGSPSSITSGGSPSPSPITVQLTSTPVTAPSAQSANVSHFQQQHTNGNSSFVNESSLTSGSLPDTSSFIDRRSKQDNIPNKTKQQPIKPTPMRATNIKTQTAESQSNKIVTSTPNKNAASQHQQHHPQPYSGTTAAAIVAAGSIQNANSNATVIPSIANAHNPAVQPHVPTPSGSAPTALPNNNSNIQNPSVVQAVPGIAFAAVAKHNPSPTVAAIVGAGIQGQQQQQQQHVSTQQQQQLNNLQLNSSHMQNGLTVNLSNDSNLGEAISLKSIAQDAINHAAVNEKDASLQDEAPSIDARQQPQQQPQNVPQQHFTADALSSQQQQQQQQQQSAHSNSSDLTSSINSHRAPLAIVTNGPATSSVTNGMSNSAAHNVTHSNSVTNVNPGHAIQQQPAQQQPQPQSTQHQQVQQPTKEAHIPPLLGVAPLGAMQLNKEHQKQFQLLEAAYHHLPERQDNERLATYFQIAPVKTPPSYPQTHIQNFDTIEFYQRLQTESLFFIFYYMEGSKAQYLAAKALKRQSWRFHTKFMMWFQRHEEPQTINDEYEQGTYVYFDYEKWQQRRKEGFTFEYKYLEDRDLQ